MNILILSSSHDYRQPRKANIHFIAEALAKAHKVRFASLGYSLISRYKGLNTRAPMMHLANRVTETGGVEAFLWKSLLHPVNLHRRWLAPLSRVALASYPHLVPATIRHWLADADIVIVECGLAITLIPLARRIRPDARIIYNASDSLETIGADSLLMRILRKNGALVDSARIPSEQLRAELNFIDDLRYIPHAVSDLVHEYPGDSPFGLGSNAVSIGSMLFDQWAVDKLSLHFPEVRFHMIGTGVTDPIERANLVWYPEMPYRETLRYLYHADVSIAPYRQGRAPSYLKDTSMKLLQADEMGIASVCPDFATDIGKKLRFAYRTGDETSLVGAFGKALATPKTPADNKRSWDDVVRCLIA